MSLVEFLKYAGTAAGINVVIGYALSFVAEWWPGYESLGAKSKRLIMMALCLVIPLLSLAGLVLFAGEPLTVDAVWSCLLAAFAAFFGSQAAHLRKLGDLTPAPSLRGKGGNYLESVADDVVVLAAEMIEREKVRRAGMAKEYEAVFGGEKGKSD